MRTRRARYLDRRGYGGATTTLIPITDDEVKILRVKPSDAVELSDKGVFINRDFRGKDMSNNRIFSRLDLSGSNFKWSRFNWCKFN